MCYVHTLRKMQKGLLVFFFFLTPLLGNEQQKIIYLVPWEGMSSILPSDEANIQDVHLLKPFMRLIQEAQKRNYLLKFTRNISNTADVKAVVFFGPNVNESKLYQDLKKYSSDKCILYVWEAVVIDPTGYESWLKNYFGKIFTHKDDLVDNKQYFKFHWPSFCTIGEEYKIPFNQKKFCSIFAANKCSSHPLEIYSERIKTIKFFENLSTNELDFYGKGWNASEYTSYKGDAVDKLKTCGNYKFNICYENGQKIPGYMTEKIFDCFACCCVPIYWGASNITEFVPADCFIDRRDFDSHDALYSFLKNIDETAYNQYLENIKKFVASPQAYKFSGDYFAWQFFETIESLKE